MSEPLRLLPPRVQLVDPRTGTMSRDWYVFFQQLYVRVGGANAPSNDDLSRDLFEDAGSSEMFARLYELSDSMQQGALDFGHAVSVDDVTPPALTPLPTEPSLAELGALREQVAELNKGLDGALSLINQLNDTIAELCKEIDALKQATIGGQP